MFPFAWGLLLPSLGCYDLQIGAADAQGAPEHPSKNVSSSMCQQEILELKVCHDWCFGKNAQYGDSMLAIFQKAAALRSY